MKRKYSAKTCLFWWIEAKLFDLNTWFQTLRVNSQLRDIKSVEVV